MKIMKVLFLQREKSEGNSEVLETRWAFNSERSRGLLGCDEVIKVCKPEAMWTKIWMHLNIMFGFIALCFEVAKIYIRIVFLMELLWNCPVSLLYGSQCNLQSHPCFQERESC